jgi:hypothetical protein
MILNYIPPLGALNENTPREAIGINIERKKIAT